MSDDDLRPVPWEWLAASITPEPMPVAFYVKPCPVLVSTETARHAW